MAEDPTTQELRVRQMKREEDARVHAEEAPEEDTSQHDRRAEKAAYLKRKLEERAEAERRAAERNDTGNGG